MPARGKENRRYQGSKWIRREKRLAIYLRDGLACVYCGLSVEDGTSLTLDHLTPFSSGGRHHAENLVTACFRCNSSRGARDWQEFCGAVAGYLNRGVTAAAIIGHITSRISTPLDIRAAKTLIARRGSFTAALNARA